MPVALMTGNTLTGLLADMKRFRMAATTENSIGVTGRAESDSLPPVVEWLKQLAHALSARFKSRARLEAENVVLRQQLNVLIRKVPKRLRLTNSDRLLLVWLYRLFPSILSAVRIVRPETVIRWHRRGFQAYWRWKSRPGAGRPPIDGQIRDLIQQMSMDNPLWGAPRIHGELLMLGIDVAQSNRREIHDAEVSTTTVTELEDLPAQPRGRHCFDRSLRGADRVFQIALWSGDPGS
jgi:hypothetical protein